MNFLMDFNSVYFLPNVVISIIGVSVTLLGTVGNFVTLYVCTRKSLRSIPTFNFLIYITILDTISLYFWKISDFTITFFGAAVADFNITACKLTTFLQYFSSQSSVYIVVAITYERLISIKTSKANYKCNAKNVSIICIAIMSFFSLLNIHVFFTLDYQPVSNSSLVGACITRPFYLTWRQFHSYLYTVIPFILIFIGNSIIIYHLQVIRKQKLALRMMHNVSKNRRAFCRTILYISMIFIILTAPFACLSGYFLKEMLSSDFTRCIFYFSMSVAFSYHGSNFIILYFSNKKFKEEFKQISQANTVKISI